LPAVKRQGEVTEVVRPELDLESVRRLALGHGHQPGVVEQQVDLRVGRLRRRGELGDRGERPEIELADLERRPRHQRLDLLAGGFGLVQVARRDDDMGAVSHKLPHRRQPQAAVASSHDRYLARLIRDVARLPAH
jgi:hypothetical protein